MGVTRDRVSRLHLFVDLPAGELEHIAEAAQELAVAAGEPVASEDDFGHALFAIEAGEVDILQDGRPLRRLGPGDIFGEIALVRSGRRTATAVAVTDVRLLTWFKRDVWQLESRAPLFAQALRASAEAHLAADDAD
jgi:CRP-like cAMP-binding protein